MTDEPPRARPTGRGLGRGLSALFGDDEAQQQAAPKDVRTLATELLVPGRFQPRRRFEPEAMEALAQSVRAQGILQPILVRRHPDDPATYEILAGERRWRAAQAAKLHEVPVIVRTITDREASEIAIVENIQREDLNAIEEAEGYRRLIEEFGHTQEALAQALGTKSRSHIANTMRLLALPGEVKEMIADGRLSAGHARALLGARNPLALAKECVRDGFSVRQVEVAVRAERASAGTGHAKPKAEPKDANVVALERELTQRFGLKVDIALVGLKGAGTMIFKFRTLDQLEEVVKKLRE